MKVIINVEDVSNKEYLLKDEKYTILIPKKFCEIIEDKKDDRDCNGCRFQFSDECISCLPESSNFEPKEEKMNDIRLTKDHARKLLDDAMPLTSYLDVTEKIEAWERKGWIIKDEIDQAIEELYRFIENINSIDTIKDYGSFSYKINFLKRNIELLQNKIKALE